VDLREKKQHVLMKARSNVEEAARLLFEATRLEQEINIQDGAVDPIVTDNIVLASSVDEVRVVEWALLKYIDECEQRKKAAGSADVLAATWERYGKTAETLRARLRLLGDWDKTMLVVAPKQESVQ